VITRYQLRYRLGNPAYQQRLRSISPEAAWTGWPATWVKVISIQCLDSRIYILGWSALCRWCGNPEQLQQQASRRPRQIDRCCQTAGTSTHTARLPVTSYLPVCSCRPLKLKPIASGDNHVFTAKLHLHLHCLLLSVAFALLQTTERAWVTPSSRIR